MAKKVTIPLYILGPMLKCLDIILENYSPRQRTIRTIEAHRRLKQYISKLKQIKTKQR